MQDLIAAERNPNQPHEQPAQEPDSLRMFGDAVLFFDLERVELSWLGCAVEFQSKNNGNFFDGSRLFFCRHLM